MMKRCLLLLSACFSVANAYGVTPNCNSVHVWYSMINDAKVTWSVQISRIYESNISFVDEQCQSIDFSKKIEVAAGQTRYAGLKIDAETGFFATYAFFGVQTGDSGRMQAMIPSDIPACGFFIAPYSPAKIDQTNWQLNNANCFASDQYGTELHFK